VKGYKKSKKESKEGLFQRFSFLVGFDLRDLENHHLNGLTTQQQLVAGKGRTYNSIEPTILRPGQAFNPRRKKCTIVVLI
jgi:hypothetical protein